MCLFGLLMVGCDKESAIIYYGQCLNEERAKRGIFLIPEADRQKRDQIQQMNSPILFLAVALSGVVLKIQAADDTTTPPPPPQPPEHEGGPGGHSPAPPPLDTVLDAHGGGVLSPDEYRTPHDVVSLNRNVKVVTLNQKAKIRELLDAAIQTATNGKGKIGFCINKRDTLFLEFPLADGNVGHWQFEAIGELHARGLEMPGIHSTASGIVIWMEESAGKWNIGGVPISVEEACGQIDALRNKASRVTVVCDISKDKPIDLLVPIWKRAQDKECKFVLFSQDYTE